MTQPDPLDVLTPVQRDLYGWLFRSCEPLDKRSAAELLRLATRVAELEGLLNDIECVHAQEMAKHFNAWERGE